MDHPAETAGGGITARQALLKAESALQHSAADNISHDVRALLAHLMEVSPLHLLAQDPLAAEYLQCEMRFSLMINDVYQILSEVIDLGINGLGGAGNGQ